jgi:4'-phosphopantetheinyl transferase
MGNSLSSFPSAIPPPLLKRELYVWRASLDLSLDVRKHLESTLSPDEKKRAEKFLVPRAREHFVAARGILRELLGAYLEVDADKVALDYAPEGKPKLSTEHNAKISFNVSHSHGVGLFAFARDQEIGVDIEYVKNEFRGMEIASHFFSEEEIAALAKLPPNQTDQAFFGCWTRKEAYVKAHGQGLSIPLRTFTVAFTQSMQVLRDEAGARWSCYALEPAPGFAGAVVAKGENWSVKYCEWLAGVKNVESARLVD